MNIPHTVTQLSEQLHTIEQRLALNDLMFELNSRQLLPRDTIENIWRAGAAASPHLRVASAAECATCPHGVLSAAESLGSGALIFPGTEDVDRAVPRDPRNANNRRTKLLSRYGAALSLVEQRAPEAVLPIRSYVIALRDECASTRIKLRDLRTEGKGAADE